MGCLGQHPNPSISPPSTLLSLVIVASIVVVDSDCCHHQFWNPHSLSRSGPALQQGCKAYEPVRRGFDASRGSRPGEIMTSYHGQSTKSTRTIVKPMLRKLTQSEKNSIDLDRPIEERDAFGIYGYGNGSANRSSHDVAFSPRGYHARSTSGTSQFSTATTGSGARVGSFVHPFQQTPRPYTPPLATTSYQASLRESEHSNSPALTEDDDHLRHPFRSNSNLSNHTHSFTSNTSPLIGSQPVRVQSKQTSSSRLALPNSHGGLPNSLTHPPDLASQMESMSPASAIRTSIDKGFRIRSRSEVDASARSESIQEARRKFDEREQAKEEKAAQVEIRAIEKRNQKEARQVERGHRRSSASDGTRNKRSKSDLTIPEKEILRRPFAGVPYESSHNEEELEQPQKSQTGFASTKQKTHGTWTKFLMWFRTRLIRIGGRRTDRHKEQK